MQQNGTAMSTETPIVTTSERRAFKRCPQRWWWEYREGLRAYEISVALWFGIGIHEALAHYYGNTGYKRNMDFVDVWRDYCDNSEISNVVKASADGWSEDESWLSAKTLGEAMLLGHHETFGGDPDWDVIYTERPFEIGIPDPRNIDNDIVIFNSTFDGVYRSKSTRKVNLMEHKTAKAITVDHLPLDDQGGSYFAVASVVLRMEGILPGKQMIDGITYNFLRKGLPDERPKDRDGYATNKPIKRHYIAALAAAGEMMANDKWSLDRLAAAATELNLKVLGDRSAVQPSPLFERHTFRRTTQERKTQIDRLANEAIVMNAMRTGDLPLYKNSNRDCHWDCMFFNMCQLHEQNVDWEEFRDAVFMVRDPYDRYRMLKSA